VLATSSERRSDMYMGTIFRRTFPMPRDLVSGAKPATGEVLTLSDSGVSGHSGATMCDKMWSKQLCWAILEATAKFNSTHG